jgi:hypothetical protein
MFEKLKRKIKIGRVADIDNQISIDSTVATGPTEARDEATAPIAPIAPIIPSGPTVVEPEPPSSVSVLALKHDHTIYEILRDAVKGIELDVNIIGLDDPVAGMHVSWYNEPSQRAVLYDKKPFFFYIEEYDTFKGRDNANHWHFDDPPPAIHYSLLTAPSPPILCHPNFRGFISHIQDTCDRLYDTFKVPVYHLSLCSTYRGLDEFNPVKEHIESLDDRPVHLIAWSSWNDIHDNNFINRGGVVVDKLVCDLLSLDCDIHFSMRTLQGMQSKGGWPERVDIYRSYLTEEEKNGLFSQGDIFLLPSDQVHSASVTYAMSFGMPCVVSDGWGMSEFCNSLTSLPVKNINAIVDIINDKEALKVKRRNTFSYYMSNHSRFSYVNSICEILHTGVNW